MPAEPRVSPWLRRRRPLDRITAAVLLVVLSPVLLVLGALVRREDGGPSLIRLWRVGQQGERFRLLKLRSMRSSGAGGVAAGPSLTRAADRRITTIGGFLRQHRLDELPQLLNVIRGEMSLLGPRPEAPDFVHTTDPRWRHVLSVAPGIAGPTQLLVEAWEGRSLDGDGAEAVYLDRILPVKLIIDAWYVTNATPVVDALVVVSLLQRFVLGRRTTAIHRRLSGLSGVPEALLGEGAA